MIEIAHLIVSGLGSNAYLNTNPNVRFSLDLRTFHNPFEQPFPPETCKGASVMQKK